jgi:hypothetical protein
MLRLCTKSAETETTTRSEPYAAQNVHRPIPSREIARENGPETFGEVTENIAVTAPPQKRIPFSRPNLFGVQWNAVGKRLHPGQGLERLRRALLQKQKRRAVIALVLTSATAVHWHFANTTPTVLLPPSLPETMSGPNAVHFYRIAADSLDIEKTKTVSPETMTLAEKREMAGVAKESLDLLRQGFAHQYQGQRTNYMRTTERLDLDTPVPNFVLQRTMARLLVCESAVYAADGKTAAALSSAMDAIRFGQDVGTDPTLIAGMIGTLIEGIGSTEAVNHVKGLSAQEARTAIKRMEALRENEHSFGSIIESERLFVNGAMLQMFSSSYPLLMEGFVSTQSPWYQNLAASAYYNANIFWYGKQGIVDGVNRHTGELVRRANLPYQEAKKWTTDTLPSLPILGKNWIPNMQRAHLSHTRNTARNRVLLAELAVQAYRAEHNGKLPASLSELTAGTDAYLSSIPNDPLSADGKQPLRYRNGKAYSVGENGKDDGGTGDDTLKQP